MALLNSLETFPNRPYSLAARTYRERTLNRCQARYPHAAPASMGGYHVTICVALWRPFATSLCAAGASGFRPPHWVSAAHRWVVGLAQRLLDLGAKPGVVLACVAPLADEIVDQVADDVGGGPAGRLGFHDQACPEVRLQLDGERGLLRHRGTPADIAAGIARERRPGHVPARARRLNRSQASRPARPPPPGSPARSPPSRAKRRPPPPRPSPRRRWPHSRTPASDRRCRSRRRT